MGNLFVHDLGGTVTWEGQISMTTELTLPSSKTVSLGGLIALTNGDALEWFDKEFEPLVSDVEKAGVSALKYADNEFIPAVNTEQQDTIDRNARKVD
jgi:hypothetical protein